MKHKRIVVTRYGGPDALQVLEEECPEPRDGEARVRVLAAGVSLPDVMMREGIHPETPVVPFTPEQSCGCRFEFLATGQTSCKSCATSNDCPTSAPKCSFGYCEQ